MATDVNNEARYDAHAANHQSLADGAYRAQGMVAPPRVFGESIDDYRRRLLAPLVHHSEEWRGVDVAKLPETALLIAEKKIYADTVAAGTNTGAGAGPLREIVSVDRTGRKIHRFYGDPENCWAQYKSPVRCVTGFNTKF